MRTKDIYRISYIEKKIYLFSRFLRKKFKFPSLNTEITRKHRPVKVIKIVKQELRYVKEYFNMKERFIINTSLQRAPSGRRRGPYFSRSRP